MKTRDLDKENSEKLVPMMNFLATYNKALPAEFPRATVPLLKDFKRAYQSLFKHQDLWSLNEHRKKVMDWLPQHIVHSQNK